MPARFATLVSRHTKDVRILDIKIANSATTIDYDLKPWPFVPNEQIANEVAFKIICAIRNGQQIPNTLKLIGQSHFKSDVGRKFTAPSVEIHISATNANQLSAAEMMLATSTGEVSHRDTNPIQSREARVSTMIKGRLAAFTSFDYYYFPNCINRVGVFRAGN